MRKAIDRQVIVDEHVDALFQLLAEIFPEQEEDFRRGINALEDATPAEQVGHLLGCAAEWFHYGK
jgi:hypothetical protein